MHLIVFNVNFVTRYRALASGFPLVNIDRAPVTSVGQRLPAFVDVRRQRLGVGPITGNIGQSMDLGTGDIFYGRNGTVSEVRFVLVETTFKRPSQVALPV